jgi:hypothetical protein
MAMGEGSTQENALARGFFSSFLAAGFGGGAPPLDPKKFRISAMAAMWKGFLLLIGLSLGAKGVFIKTLSRSRLLGFRQ